MTYRLGVDLGTTYTAAAVCRDDRAEMLGLSGRGPVIPSVVCLRADGSVLVGDDAERRAASEPDRVAREFKRRIGDSAPLLVGGTPIGAEALQAELLEFVVQRATTLEGGPPDDIVVTHPANWGPYKRELLVETIREADLDPDVVRTLTEPEAAAIHYAAQARVEEGSVVAVYDLGGGTFDAAVLRRTAGGYEILGRPTGIERLGGIDFDEAVFEHVRSQIDLGDVDDRTDDLDTRAAWAALRRECVAAKEALASATDTEVQVVLPGVRTQVRLTRSEFEEMILPAVGRTTESLSRAIESAGVTPDQLTSVLLVGGSSRIPLIGQQISEAIGRPVAIDAHPKYAIAQGAALSMPEASPAGAATLPATTLAPADPPPGSFGVVPVPIPPAGSFGAPDAPSTPPATPATAATPAAGDATQVLPSATAVPSEAGPPIGPPDGVPPAPPFSSPQAASSKNRVPLLVGGGVALVLLVIGAFVLLGGGDDSGDAEVTSNTVVTEVPSSTETTTGSAPAGIETTDAGLDLPRTVNWSHVDFQLDEAVFSTIDPATFGKADPAELTVGDAERLFLDLSMAYEADYPIQSENVEVSLFSLRLDDGTTVPAGGVQFQSTYFLNTSSNDLVQLSFDVAPDQLDGAVLVIDDRVTVPAELPLDGEVPDDPYPISFDVDQTVAVTIDDGCEGTTTVESVEWDVDAGIDHNGDPVEATEPRAKKDARWVRVFVQTVAGTGEGCRFDRNVQDPDYALEIDGLPVFTSSFVNEIVQAGEGVELVLAYEVPLDAETVELNLGSLTGTQGKVEVPRPDEFP